MHEMDGAERTEQELIYEQEMHDFCDLMRAVRWALVLNEAHQIERIWYSDALRRLIGYENEQDFPNTISMWAGVIHPDDAAMARERFAAAMQELTGQTAFDFRMRIRKKDGTYIWVRSAAKIRKDEARRVYTLVGIFVDITDTVRLQEMEAQLLAVNETQKAQLEQIRAMNRQYARLLEEEKQHTAIISALGNMCALMSYLDLEARTMQLMISQQSRQYLSGEKRDAERMIETVIVSNVADKYIPAMRSFLELDTIDARLSDKPLISQTFMDRAGDWHRGSLIPVKKDENGRNLAVLCVLRTITAEIETIESQDYLIQALAIPYENTYTVNGSTGETVCYHMEETAAETYGRRFKAADYEDSLRIYAERAVLEEDRPLFDEIRFLPRALALLTEKRTHSFVYRLIRNQKLEYFQCQMVMPNPARKEFIIAFRNVSDEKRQELEQQQKMEEAYVAAEAASKAKTEFLLNMSHDIRTPMNAIIGFTNLLLTHLDDKALATSYIKKIQTSNEFLLSIINNILDMARIESGKEMLDEVACYAPDFCAELIPVFEGQMREKGITFLHRETLENQRIFIDQTKMRKILLNLLSNAYKYTPAGGTVSMTVTEQPSDQPGYTVYQNVIEDTGIGMSEEFQAHLFEEFSREHTSTETKLTGTGLGMPIVKRLVELMHGTIEVESALGKGTKIILTIPHRIAPEPEELPKQEEKAQHVCFAGKRILLAEDNELNAEIATTILEELSFAVEHAADGVHCVDILEKAEAGYYDLILMDIQMPNMDGYKATQAIRRLPDPRKAEIPILAMTANAFEEDRKHALSVGMNGHLAKPIEIPKLMEALSSVLGNHN